MKPLFEVAGHIASGRLRIVMPTHPPQPVKVALLYPARKMQSKRVQALIDAMHARTRTHIAAELAQINE